MQINLLYIFKKKIFWVLLPSLLFLVLGIWTLPHYGMNWDEPIHFMRGQAYLHYFLTGEKDYKSLPAYPRLDPECKLSPKNCSISPGGPFDLSVYQGNITHEEALFNQQPVNIFAIKRSYYQSDGHIFDDFIAMEEGHPPLGGILAALTNKIFYQHLHLLGDIESYHLFEVLTAFLIVAGVSLFIYYNYGVFPALIAGFSLGLYPLFFGESHLNIKDPPLASFFGLAIIAFYFGIVKVSWIWITVSAIFVGLAMGIKFNVVFLPFILGPWLLFYLAIQFFKRKKINIFRELKKRQGILFSLISFPLVVAVVFYVLWPYLWLDPLNNFLKIVGFYRQIGTGTPHELSEYLIKGWNTYPILWIIYTTPIPILLLTIAGILGTTHSFLFKRQHLPLLLLFWFFIPILRVSWPGSSIYGGVRQIMEYIPAMAALSGAGAFYFIVFFQNIWKSAFAGKSVQFAIITSLLFVLYEMVTIHPNQNVYFNQLVGGLSGAREKGIPYWGNSYGNVYQQGIAWLNANAEPGAKLGFPVSTGGNLARVKLRPDIQYWNAHWSGPNMGGEYEMELDFDWAPKEWYSYAYYDTFVKPVYVAQVDGVPLLKIWKNDFENTKPEYREEVEYRAVSKSLEEGQLKINLGKVVALTRITVEHSTKDCEVQKGGFVETSEDGLVWKRDPETIAAPQVPITVNGWDEDTFVFMFAARKGQYLTINTQMQNSCILKNPQITVKGLPSIPRE